jgi:hypothetical protein
MIGAYVRGRAHTVKLEASVQRSFKLISSEGNARNDLNTSHQALPPKAPPLHNAAQGTNLWRKNYIHTVAELCQKIKIFESSFIPSSS